MATRSMVLLLLATSLAIVTIPHPSVATTFEFDLAPDNSLAPDSDIIYSPEPAPKSPFWVCASKITLDCAVEISSNDFFRVHVAARCCRQLIRMGKKCNDFLVDDLISEFDKKRAGSMRNRSDHLWNRCLKVLDN